MAWKQIEVPTPLVSINFFNSRVISRTLFCKDDPKELILKIGRLKRKIKINQIII
jgi:hypothetical protein